ncbi:MAG: RidA family protein [Gammaproteobacteria bacterium]|nr:RidA family protein [Gammaproteobacteria bacterium]MBT4494667.1 RidA family protein [Gammaproteobacteria bacterium]MBT7370923.1 RidA family protein [Gammaproteobacteria bacterium]
MKKVIFTTEAPAAIGTYSQAIQEGRTIYLSGQIPLVAETMDLISEDVDDQINQVFDNLSAVLHAAGASLADVVKFTVYLTDLTDFPQVNEIMAQRLAEPFPARAAVQVAALPKGAKVEIDAIARME